MKPEGTIIVVTKVELNKTSLSLKEGGEETLTATVTPATATNKAATWSSSDTGVATVGSNGKVTAVAEGTATITAKAGEQTAKCEVTASEEIPVEPDPGGENEILFFVDSSEADFAAEKFAAGSDITDNSLFMLNATVAMETSFGKEYGLLQNGSNAVSFKNMAGEAVNPNVGIKLSDAIKTTKTVDDIFTVTAKKDVTLCLYVVWANDSFNSNKTDEVFYSVNGGEQAKQSIAKRNAIWMIEVSLKTNEVLTVGATNTHADDGKLWLFGAEAKVSAE